MKRQRQKMKLTKFERFVQIAVALILAATGILVPANCSGIAAERLAEYQHALEAAETKALETPKPSKAQEEPVAPATETTPEKPVIPETPQPSPKTDDDLFRRYIEKSIDDQTPSGVVSVSMVYTVPVDDEIANFIATAAPAPEETAEPAEPAGPVKDYDYYNSLFTEEIRDMLAKILFREGNVVKKLVEKAMLIWVIFNRLDSSIDWFGEDLEGIMTKPWQFDYRPDDPVTPENRAIVDKTIDLWCREKSGEENVGRPIPSYVLFWETDENAEGHHNAFYYYSNGLSGEKIYWDYNNPLANVYD